MNSRRAFSLLPFGYWLVTRANSPRDFLYLVATSWVPAWWLLVRLADVNVLAAGLDFAIGYIAFQCVYEVGYLVNDAWDTQVSAGARKRLPFTVTAPYVAAFLLIRALVWIAIAWRLDWIANSQWIIGFAWLVLAFAEHNLLRSRALRVASFVQLTILRFLLPIAAIVPPGRMATAATAALLFYVYLRTLSYMDSKDLLQMPERAAPDFSFRQTLVLVPAIAALAFLLREPVLIELLVYFLTIYGAWWLMQARSTD